MFQSEINDFEEEAKRLEAQEAELIKKLEQTQDQEKRVYEELKDAILEQAIGHKKRKQQLMLVGSGDLQ